MPTELPRSIASRRSSCLRDTVPMSEQTIGDCRRMRHCLRAQLDVRYEVRVAAGYDAFLSYSHAVDGRLAPALQLGLHRFGRRWNRLRALRVFRDDASLSANPSLWASIVDALDASQWLVLMASPEAAASPWVNREVDHWRASKGGVRILLVVTDGDVVWDARTGRLDWSRTTALPGAIDGAFSDEPRFVDLRWAKHETDVSLANARFREAVADVAATLHDRPKDELLGEDVRQHKLVRRLTFLALSTLALLLVSAVIAAFVAFDQRGEARSERDRAETERDRAEEQAQIALSGQLAAEAVAATDAELDTAVLLAVEAHALDPGPRATSALLGALLREPRLVGVAPIEEATDLAFIGSTELAVGREDGSVVLVDLADLTATTLLDASPRGAIVTFATTIDGRTLAAASGEGEMHVWDLPAGRRRIELDVGQPISAITLDDESGRAALVAEDGTALVVDLDGAAPGIRIPSTVRPAASVRLTRRNTLAIGESSGREEEWTLTEPSTLLRETRIGVGMPLTSAWSSDHAVFALQPSPQVVGQPYVFHADAPGESVALVGPAVTADERVESMAFSPDGTHLATADVGKLVVWALASGQAVEELSGIPGAQRSGAVAVSQGFGAAASAGGRGVAVWNTAHHPLVSHVEVGGALPLSQIANAFRGPGSLALGPGGRAAWRVGSSVESEVVVMDLEDRAELMRIPASDSVIGFDSEGERLALRRTASGATVVDLTTGEVTDVESVPWATESLSTTPAPADRPWTVEHPSGIGASLVLNGIVTLWDVSRAQPIATVDVEGEFFSAALAFNPEGDVLGIAAGGGEFARIELDPERLVEIACDRAGRTLSPQEAQRFLLDRQPSRLCG